MLSFAPRQGVHNLFTLQAESPNGGQDECPGPSLAAEDHIPFPGRLEDPEGAFRDDDPLLDQVIEHASLQVCHETSHYH